jgi:sRNA-binding carbon storage regulator CsrA
MALTTYIPASQRAAAPRGLHLTRFTGERIILEHAGETLVLTVTAVARIKPGTGEVRLSFDGPRSFEVWREEKHPGHPNNTAAVPRTGLPPAEPAAAVDYQPRHQGLATPALGTLAG